jgi:AcrR family transcriptional regulator
VRVSLSRDLLVQTARAHVERAGAEELSLRAVARDLGVTAPALYAHVAGKRELLAAVAADHFERLVERFEAIDAADPLDRIRALARAYVDHARASPALFRLMLSYPPLATPEAEAFPPAARAFEVAAAATADAIDQGLLAVEDLTLACLTMWAAVHGVAEVLLMGFGFDDATAERLLATTVETVLVGQSHPLPATTEGRP